MAIYRQIQIEYWRDAFVLDLTPEERYFYIYLLTNSKTLQCGVYELPSKIIEIETGYSKETIDKLINRFINYNKISYDFNTKEIYIKNWLKYNKIVNVKIQKCVEKEIKNVKSQTLLSEFIEDSITLGYNLQQDLNLPVEISPSYKAENILKVTQTKDNIENIKEELDVKTEEVESEEAKTDNVSNIINTQAKTKVDNNIDNLINNKIKEFTKVYEANIGLINNIAAQWLIETSNKIDIDLFKKSIEIAKEKGKLNKGYINGIINQWNNNNINNYKDLKLYEEKLMYRGKNNNGGSKEYQQSKYATELQNEDESIYKKPTREQIEHSRALLTGI